jgi:hypothetical protein
MDADWIYSGPICCAAWCGAGVVYASLIQVRKFVAILMFLLVIILASFFLQQQVSLSHLVWLAFPLSIFLTMVIMQWKRK